METKEGSSGGGGSHCVWSRYSLEPASFALLFLPLALHRAITLRLFQWSVLVFFFREYVSDGQLVGTLEILFFLEPVL